MSVIQYVKKSFKNPSVFHKKIPAFFPMLARYFYLCVINGTVFTHSKTVINQSQAIPSSLRKTPFFLCWCNSYRYLFSQKLPRSSQQTSFLFLHICYKFPILVPLPPLSTAFPSRSSTEKLRANHLSFCFQSAVSANCTLLCLPHLHTQIHTQFRAPHTCTTKANKPAAWSRDRKFNLSAIGWNVVTFIRHTPLVPGELAHRVSVYPLRWCGGRGRYPFSSPDPGVY